MTRKRSSGKMNLEFRVESEVGTETGVGDGGRHGGDIAGSNYKKVWRVESGE
jgi:hypothetical protein